MKLLQTLKPTPNASRRIHGSDKRDQVRGESLGLLPMRTVPGPPVRHQTRAGDGPVQRLLLGTEREPVAIAPDQERRYRYLVEPVREVNRQKRLEGHLPHPRRHFRALDQNGLEELGRHGPRERALLKLAHDLRIDWINEELHRLEELAHRLVTR